jgi:hypothetical protein
VAIGQASLAYSPAPDPSWGTFNGTDFARVFQADSSLDKVAVFNLVLLPGIADNGIWSEALSFCERRQAFVILDPPAQDSADGFRCFALRVERVEILLQSFFSRFSCVDRAPNDSGLGAILHLSVRQGFTCHDEHPC